VEDFAAPDDQIQIVVNSMGGGDDEHESDEHQAIPASALEGCRSARLPIVTSTGRCVALDLDETLIYASDDPLCAFDYLVECVYNGRKGRFHVAIRPGADEFITRLKMLGYDVFIYTAGTCEYARAVLNAWLPDWPRTRLLTRSSCAFIGGVYAKDLKRIKRSMADVVLVDNSQSSFLFQPENGILVTTWRGGSDGELIGRVLPLLERCASAADVRPVISEWLLGES
jgi:Dullard-like phosphatase family protein